MLLFLLMSEVEISGDDELLGAPFHGPTMAAVLLVSQPCGQLLLLLFMWVCSRFLQNFRVEPTHSMLRIDVPL